MRLHYLLFSFLLLIFAAGCGSSRQSVNEGAADNSRAEALERIADLKDNIEDEPNNIQWRQQLAGEYKTLGQNMDALKTLEDALVLDPGRSDVRYEYAELALQLGDKRKAYESYKQILQGLDGQQYVSRIAPMFVDRYAVSPLVASSVPEAFGCYSPDGNKILYQAFNGQNWDIYEYDRVAEQTKQITTNPADEENPVYNPAGGYIAYTSTRDDHRDLSYDRKLRDIYLLDTERNIERNLTTNSSNDWRPRYSKNGKFITFVSERDDLRDVDFLDLYSNIYIMESDGSFQLRLTKSECNDGGPVMTGGESDPIYFDSNKNGNFAIYKMDGNGENIHQITHNSEFNDVAPDISADGRHIVFFSDRDGNYELYMMNADGSNEIRLTSNSADDMNPMFSPDGKKVLFHSNRNGNFDIFELDLEKSNETPEVYDVVQRIDEALVNL